MSGDKNNQEDRQITCAGDRWIYISVRADAPVEKITLVKNCRDYMFIRRPEQLFIDYEKERGCDSYYLRVQLKDGRFGWTSPIWVNG